MNTIFLKYLLLVFIIFTSFGTRAQIILKDYKCKFYDGQWPHTMAVLGGKSDTFRFLLHSRDISMENESDDPQKDLQIGLRLCFQANHYIKTKDNLYIYTGKDFDTALYVYKIYIPEAEVSLSLLSKNNDTQFSDKSKWLLSQVRIARSNHKDMYFINERHQSCQDPSKP